MYVRLSRFESGVPSTFSDFDRSAATQLTSSCIALAMPEMQKPIGRAISHPASKRDSRDARLALLGSVDARKMK
jgi:hypothetical protein